MKHSYLENPEMIHENKLKPRATMSTYSDFEAYKACLKTDQLLLSGKWQFRLTMGIENKVKNFFEPTYEASTWEAIDVPGLWQLQGYHKIDKPYYLAYSYPPAIKTKHIPSIIQEENSVGQYRRYFNLSKEHLKQSIRLHFGGVKSAFSVWLNGDYIGYSQGSMTPAEFSISEKAIEGDNLLAVEVYRYSDGTYLEDQDMWFLSGIFRDVYVEIEPLDHIEDVYVAAEFRDNYHVAKIKTQVEISHLSSESRAFKIKTALVNLQTKDETYLSESMLVIPGMESRKSVLEAEVHAPSLWSAETPNLYHILVSLTDHYDQVIQVKAIQFGFKETKIVDGVFLFNGQPLLIKGVNRHEFDPYKAWVPSRELYLKDFAIMKSLNINAIRTSHYPNDPLFYELCNELGFYIMDEADVESHGVRRKGIPGKKLEWQKAIIDRGVRMVARDRNHPCIMIWSLGNEAGYGPNFIEMKKAMLALDNTRPYHYEGDLELFVSDFFSTMYGEPAYMEGIGKEEDLLLTLGQKVQNLLMAEYHEFRAEQYKGKPAILCEYAHAMNNSLGNFEDYMKVFKQFPRLCGGFIWDFVDQTLIMVGDGEEHCLYGGDFDEEVTNGQFCANGIIASNRRLHPSAYEVKKVYQAFSFELDLDTSLLKVYNEQHFRDSSAYELCYRILENGEVIKEEHIHSFDLPSGEKCVYDLELQGLMSDSSSMYHVDVEVIKASDDWWCKKGYVVAFEQFEKLATEHETVRIEPFEGDVDVDKNHLMVKVKDTEYSFNLKSGFLEQVNFEGKALFVSPLKPNFWRVQTDNDLGLSHYVPFLRRFVENDVLADLSHSVRVKDFDHHKEGSHYLIKFDLKMPGFLGVFNLTYEIDGQGELTVIYMGTPKKALDRFGAVVELVGNYEQISWFGKGPHENYCDRNTGARVGIYHHKIDEMVHPYVRPQENGQRTGTYWVDLSDNKNDLHIESLGDSMEFSVWPYNEADLKAATHPHEQSFYLGTSLHIDGRQKGVGGDYPGILNLKETYKILKKVEQKCGFRFKISSDY